VARALGTWFCEQVCHVIQILLVQHVSAIRVHHQLIEVNGDGVMRVKHVRKWCREFENIYWTPTIVIAPVVVAHGEQMEQPILEKSLHHNLRSLISQC
jgi:hypothetical protein